jgi:DNA-binding CsgD family transcriptional regulator
MTPSPGSPSPQDLSALLPRLAAFFASSARKREICALLCHGHSNRTIAEALGMSVNTVDTHLRQLYAGLKIKHRTVLVHLTTMLDAQGTVVSD